MEIVFNNKINDQMKNLSNFLSIPSKDIKKSTSSEGLIHCVQK